MPAGYEAIASIATSRNYEVWDAWSRERGCRCVAKLVRAERRDHAPAHRRLLREGELLLAASHPHLVRAYELHRGPEPVLIMETLGGESVSRLIERRGGPLESRDVAMLGLQLGSALRYLHGRGVLHLDVKPGNAIAEAGQAKLIDLSLARPPGPAPAGAGTWAYMAPEQVRGEELSAAADVWGLGALLYEAATGEAAFDDSAGWTTDESAETLSTYDGPFPQLEAPADRLAARLRSGLGPVIDACLNASAEARPAIDEVLSELVGVAEIPAARRMKELSDPPHGDLIPRP